MVSLRSSDPFRFQAPSATPDPDVGIALGQGGMRGTFQAGVVHAFIVSQCFPGVIAGTSSGCITGTALALAAQMDRQSERLALAEQHIDLWIQNPAQIVLDSLVRGPFGTLARDLTGIDLTLGEIASLLGGDLVPIVHLLLGLPRASARVRRGVLAGISGAVSGALHGLSSSGPMRDRLAREAMMSAVQHVLAAYDMEHSLSPTDLVQDHFAAMVERFAPGGRGCTFGALDRTELVFQAANLSRRTVGGESTVLDLGRGGWRSTPDFSGANLVAAMRASCAFMPLFAGVRARELGMRHLPHGLGDDHLLMDGAAVAKDALSPAVHRWTHRPSYSAARHRLFTVHLEPLVPVSIPPGTSPFAGQALHSLKLRDGLDQRYAAAIIDQMTTLVDALQRGGAQVERKGGGRYVPVDTTAIAPVAMLPFEVLSVPTRAELREACAAGCRAGLEALHGETLKAFSGTGLVRCDDLLKRLRAKHDAPFQPLLDLCAACTGDLCRPRVIEPMMSQEEQDRLNAFSPFSDQQREPKGAPERLTIAVPAGGVFLGIFQFGAIAALADYDIQPDLYAGASVGTIFSYLLESNLRKGVNRLPEIVKLALEVPSWVDTPAGAPSSSGALDRVRETILARWASDDVRPLRDLRPREIAALFEAPPHGATAATWESFRKGLGALLFTPIPGPAGKSTPALDPRYRLESDEWKKVHCTLAALTRLRLDGAVELFDEIAANLRFFRPGPEADRGEIIGFDSITEKLESLVFSGAPPPTLAQHSADRRVRFIFTATNHTRGKLENFGFADGSSAATASPGAIEATLAASSFPLAFRRRLAAEIFGEARVPNPGDFYADGGIFNNFPSDIAFAYLQALSGLEETRWIGGVTHRVLLLSLTSPTTFEGDLPEEEGLVWNFLRAMGKSDDEKVRKTQRGQFHVNALAAKANPLLRAEGKPQAIQAEMILISPAYGIYGHPFAFKPYLGFEVGKQEEMLASGCRRTRLALEWNADLKKNGDPRRLPLFLEEIKDEVRKVEGMFSRYPAGTCVFGRFGPGGQSVLCRFAESEATRVVFDRCKETIDRELSVPDLKL